MTSFIGYSTSLVLALTVVLASVIGSIRRVMTVVLVRAIFLAGTRTVRTTVVGFFSIVLVTRRGVLLGRCFVFSAVIGRSIALLPLTRSFAFLFLVFYVGIGGGRYFLLGLFLKILVFGCQ